jgi:hypothetical protein
MSKCPTSARVISHFYRIDSEQCEVRHHRYLIPLTQNIHHFRRKLDESHNSITAVAQKPELDEEATLDKVSEF